MEDFNVINHNAGYIQEYLNYIKVKHNLSDRTLLVYKRVLLDAFIVCNKDNILIEEIDSQYIFDFMRNVYVPTYSESSIRRACGVISRFFEYCYIKGYRKEKTQIINPLTGSICTHHVVNKDRKSSKQRTFYDTTNMKKPKKFLDKSILNLVNASTDDNTVNKQNNPSPPKNSTSPKNSVSSKKFYLDSKVYKIINYLKIVEGLTDETILNIRITDFSHNQLVIRIIQPDCFPTVRVIYIPTNIRNLIYEYLMCRNDTDNRMFLLITDLY